MHCTVELGDWLVDVGKSASEALCVWLGVMLHKTFHVTDRHHPFLRCHKGRYFATAKYSIELITQMSLVVLVKVVANV